ncbi:MAG: DUF1045 domain-containing protein [Telmatospirillum sp.]|nr:DUF1045 domain-containing protein [Telmatospirillum sp.]
MSAHRYAIYAVPPIDHPLWPLACAWLGRDPVPAASLPDGGPAPVSPPDLHSLEAGRFRVLTRDAARYGFHGTLKAPFRLAVGADAGALIEEAGRFIRRIGRIRIPLAIADDLGFTALRPVGTPPVLAELAAAAVRTFEPFRAPLSPAERARRLKSPLSPRQCALLDQWGYPYVMDEFRFHMTLADRCDDPSEQAALRQIAEGHFGPALARPVPLAVSLFVEPKAGSDFVMVPPL